MNTVDTTPDVVVVTSSETKQSTPEPSLTRMLGAYYDNPASNRGVVRRVGDQ